jgi:hypothetical protein
MISHPDSNPDWGNQYHLIASERGIRQYSDGEKAAFGVAVVLASGKKLRD